LLSAHHVVSKCTRRCPDRVAYSKTWAGTWIYSLKQMGVTLCTDKLQQLCRARSSGLRLKTAPRGWHVSDTSSVIKPKTFSNTDFSISLLYPLNITIHLCLEYNFFILTASPQLQCNYPTKSPPRTDTGGELGELQLPPPEEFCSCGETPGPPNFRRFVCLSTSSLFFSSPHKHFLYPPQ